MLPQTTKKGREFQARIISKFIKLLSKISKQKNRILEEKRISLKHKRALFVQDLKGRARTRELCRIRDKYTCQDCGFYRSREEVRKENRWKRGLRGRIKSLDVHHLDGLCGKKSLGYDKLEMIPRLITLCHKCHYNRPEHRVKQKSAQSKNK